jgi:plasmid stability protein
MTPELVADLRARARGNNRSMSGEIREIIRAHFDLSASCDISAQDTAQTFGD